ncbi:hypothetical protein G5C51_29335 [Streptomyces sp. A7024]|uniref:Uncharacterized protein n=1 Tax=Streptomyces coryli TaxID=1128680 RepID=A0A6G4U8D8_9ACTN|nr:hypothetical protein [Streptomyces coryli]NGN67990.1 hypothetical protein [Streptomyces coryli]
MTTALAPPELRRDRYIQDVLALTDRLSLRGLADRDDLVHRARHPGGRTVVAALGSTLPERYLLVIHGFRLAQYLRSRFADDTQVHARGLFAEPHKSGPGEELHVIGIDDRSGRILRYVSLTGAADRRRLPLADPRRGRFPVEVAHGIRLFDLVPAAAGADTGQVWEIKRLMRGGADAAAPGLLRMRMSLELMLGFYTALGRLDPAPAYLIGDGEEGLAIRRLLRSLKHITVIEGTHPALPPGDLLAPAYVHRREVKPFVAQAPHGAELAELLRWLREALAAPDPLAGFRELVGRVHGEVKRVRA